MEYSARFELYQCPYFHFCQEILQFHPYFVFFYSFFELEMKLMQLCKQSGLDTEVSYSTPASLGLRYCCAFIESYEMRPCCFCLVKSQKLFWRALFHFCQMHINDMLSSIGLQALKVKQYCKAKNLFTRLEGRLDVKQLLRSQNSTEM